MKSQRTRLDAATEHLDPPVAVVDLDAFDRNAADLARRADGRPIRIASKSVRCRFLLERALRTPGFEGVMSYALREALWLNREWAGTDLADTDILVAYPTADRAALRELAADDKARDRISVIVDSVSHLDFIDATLGEDHPEIRVCIELDVSWRPLGSRHVHIGPYRSPVFTPKQAADLAVDVSKRPGFRLVGVMGYEGQIAGLGDTPAGNPVLGVIRRWMQGRSAQELVRRRGKAVRAVVAVQELEFVNGGGTGSIEVTRADSSVTEIAAGSGLIGPTLFDNYSRFTPQPAVLFAVPVVRKPGPGFATLLGGGYLASGPANSARLPRPYLPEGLKLLSMEGAGEVQTPVTGPAADSLRVGDRVWMRHAKAGELAERFSEYHVLDGDKLTMTVPTYRGEDQSFG
ncbi:D-serine deaminase, pyridoxal phosphate-dependent [Actinokineospora alba]|uniref:D-serine deaminase, pyridoxal phosphate-dependent n=1 Tax=Actinokineospora alba TaxID=504798 RepID=A0A1H0WBI6_9PSEU|nr:amino acid deaminase/aldolase [Actinokineospora alba]TDP66162.1 D-serine deaminase-like pyridoxal phosphate-dependent protein [Actinokineospora alba]SDJ41816.1 D-serine deaminase, pyridoxal phosphate-dependent [Actinokineospora alba]SDP87805.1 D-serine deaminase, pyridoxal phosphate-dependent [Actinokineospora alba]